MTSPHDVGLWQEILIWKAITDVFERKLGPAAKNTTQVGYVKQTLTWSTGTHTYEVKWHTPNTHPGEPGKFSSPEFGILVDQDRVMNIESKNWAPNYKPLSADSTKSQIISRFQYLTANQNLVIITDWIVEKSDSLEIQSLLNQWNIHVILTGRQAEAPDDWDSYRAIYRQLKPILLSVLK
jgi:hypothetical protein